LTDNGTSNAQKHYAKTLNDPRPNKKSSIQHIGFSGLAVQYCRRSHYGGNGRDGRTDGRAFPSVLIRTIVFAAVGRDVQIPKGEIDTKDKGLQKETINSDIQEGTVYRKLGLTGHLVTDIHALLSELVCESDRVKIRPLTNRQEVPFHQEELVFIYPPYFSSSQRINF
jgi:hypothetical protein